MALMPLVRHNCRLLKYFSIFASVLPALAISKIIFKTPLKRKKMTIQAYSSSHIFYINQHNSSIQAQEVKINELFTAIHNQDIENLTELLNQIPKNELTDFVNRPCKRGDTLLSKAAEKGSAEAVTLLLEAGADINYANPKCGNTALILATWENHADVIEILINNGADLNIGDSTGETALMVATRENFSDAISKLINYGADVNLQNNHGNTALALLVKSWRCDVEIAKILIKSGANVDLEDNDKNNPLIIAARLENPSLIEALVAAAASVNLSNNQGTTALMNAAEFVDNQAVMILRNAGANINQTDNNGKKAIDILNSTHRFANDKPTVNKNLTADWPINKNQYLIKLAAKHDYTNIVNNLIATGIFTQQMLSEALLSAAESGSIDTATILLNNGADVDYTQSNGNTALIKSIIHRNTDLTNLLINKNADVSKTNNRNQTSLTIASSQGKHELIETLLESFI